jgi:hypothetical protein
MITSKHHDSAYLSAASRHCSATSSKMQIAILLSSGVLSLPCIQKKKNSFEWSKNKGSKNAKSKKKMLTKQKDQYLKKKKEKKDHYIISKSSK